MAVVLGPAPRKSGGLMSLSVLASITADMAREMAGSQGVCIRPILRRVLDRETGTETRVPIPCDGQPGLTIRCHAT